MNELDLGRIFATQALYVNRISLPPPPREVNIPTFDPCYEFDMQVLNEVLLYLKNPLGDGLYLSGPSGCGKTTFIHQVAARLNWGLEQITLSSRSESQDLIGHAALRRGELVYEYGPLVRAMIYGEILLLNEIDLMSPADLAALNDVLEGKPLTITANSGEVIRPSPYFRVIATGNTRGCGDITGFYNGARLQNQAFLDRWRFLNLDYPKESVEARILAREAGCTGDNAKYLLKLAKELRRVSTVNDEGISQLSAPFSTRVLLRIASLAKICPHLSMPKIVDMGFGARLPDPEREYVKRLSEDIFGHGGAGIPAPKDENSGAAASDGSLFEGSGQNPAGRQSA